MRYPDGRRAMNDALDCFEQAHDTFKKMEKVTPEVSNNARYVAAMSWLEVGIEALKRKEKGDDTRG